MVTKEHLAQLRARRSKQYPTLDYTPNGIAYKRIKAEHNLLNEHRIRQGERSFQHASDTLRRDYSASRFNGYTKANFNHITKKQEIKP